VERHDGAHAGRQRQRAPLRVNGQFVTISGSFIAAPITAQITVTGQTYRAIDLTWLRSISMTITEV
jgi:hypothetical protein